jgi:hypothetical protein
MAIAFSASAIISRRAISIGLDPSFRTAFARVAAGRTLAIGYFTSRLLGSLIGDLDLRWVEEAPGGSIELPAGFIALEPLAGVGLAADQRLLELLSVSGPTIVASRSPFATGVDVRLEDAGAWIDFLDSPAARRAPLY